MRQRLNSSYRHSSGFTIIELLLAMSFVAILIVFILTATIQITKIYNKGITLKQVNQSGASLAGELQSSLKAADAPLNLDSMSSDRLCLGTYSYVWNLKDSTDNRYSGSDSSTKIGLVKVDDATGKLCGSTHPDVDKSAATELVAGNGGTGSLQLQLRKFDVTEQANSGINYIYDVDYVIATPDSDNSLIAATPSADSDACKGSPGDDFCALNSFNFQVFMRKGGSGKVQ